MRLRLYESAITSRSVFLRKICGPATFEFCNKIGTEETCQPTSTMSAIGEISGPVVLTMSSSAPDPEPTLRSICGAQAKDCPNCSPHANLKSAFLGRWTSCELSEASCGAIRRIGRFNTHSFNTRPFHVPLRQGHPTTLKFVPLIQHDTRP